MATPPRPLPIIFTDPLWQTGGLGGASKLPVAGALPAGSGMTFGRVETTEQKRNKEFHQAIGNPFFIDFAGILNSPDAARLGRSMLNYGEHKVADWVDNIPTNLFRNSLRGEINPTSSTSFLRLGVEAAKATIGGTMTRGLATGLAGKAAGSVLSGVAVGAMIQPITMGDSTIQGHIARENAWIERMRPQWEENEAKAKMIDEEYTKKMGNKYAGIETLMETPMWKRDTSAQFTPEERKLQNYEEVIAQRFKKVETASRERAKLENGFYNDKGDFMSAHFIRNSQ